MKFAGWWAAVFWDGQARAQLGLTIVLVHTTSFVFKVLMCMFSLRKSSQAKNPTTPTTCYDHGSAFFLTSCWYDSCLTSTLSLSVQYLMKLQLVLQEREVEISSKAPCFHLVETVPSILRKMPGVVLREHTVGIQGKLKLVGVGEEWCLCMWPLTRESKECHHCKSLC